MEKKKALIVNCAFCDARQVQESTLEAYEKVAVNCAVLVTSPESRALLDRYSVMLNAAQATGLEEAVTCSTINGTGRIGPNQAAPDGKVFLIVNGTLEVEPGSQEALRHYAGMIVNGSVTCPKSMAGFFSGVRINGAIHAYPDGCIRLKKTFRLDRTFVLRAKQDAHYFTSGRIIALDPDTGFDKLAERNVRFTTRTLLVAESLAEAAVPLFSEDADIIVLPDGCAFINDDVLLDDALLCRYGGKLYVNGDLTVDGSSAPCLEKLEFLRINGDLLATRSMEKAVQGLRAEYDRLRLVAGTRLCGKTSLKVDRALLEDAKDGVDIIDCVKVTFQEDVPAELIREKVMNMSNCVSVRCTEEQRSAIETIAEDVASINGEKEDGEDDGPLQMVADFLGIDIEGMTLEEKAQLLKSCKIVNAASYTL